MANIMKIKKVKESQFNIQWQITLVTLAILLTIVIFLVIRPEITITIIDRVFNFTIRSVGSVLLAFNLSMVILCFYFAFSKYGKIKFGEGKPEYSTFSYIAMMACAALAAASLFWSFTEWANYYAEPGLGLEGYSQASAEMSLAYAYFHWGLGAQCIYVISGLVMGYALYVRKMKSMKMSVICEAMMDNFKYKKILGKIIDGIVVFCTLGGLGVTLGLGVPMIAGGLSRIFGMEETFLLQVSIVLMIGAIFSYTSFIGTKRGMQKLSSYTVYLVILFLAYILIAGPTEFIMKNAANSMGLMIDNFARMALFTDPITNSGFAEKWTIFFWAFPMTYAALMGVFTAKISKGRTIKEFTLCCLFGVSIGGWIIFAINTGFALNYELSGLFSMTELINSNTAYRGIFDLLDLLPGGGILAIMLVLVLFGFISTSLDSASLALATTTSKRLDKDSNPSPLVRVFWCGMLTLLPLSMMFSGAPFEALKTLAILVSTPLAIVLGFMAIGLLKWLKIDIQKEDMLEFEKDDSLRAYER